MRYQKSIAISSRHKKLLALIRSGNFSCQTLAKKLDVSEQTIYRDIDFLKQRGHFIRSIKRADGWAYELSAEPATIADGKGSSHQ
jgi:DeoR/GlpR family transcriptional regulator of sugar metabolism